MIEIGQLEIVHPPLDENIILEKISSYTFLENHSTRIICSIKGPLNIPLNFLGGKHILKEVKVNPSTRYLST